jgi:prepilin-type N-terminal cleavage/methylation domain-containing protein
MKFLTTTRQSGFTLIEILLVIGIIAILAIAAFVIYPQVQTSSRANTEQSNITSISAGIKNLYGTTHDYATLNNGVANLSGVIPPTMNGGNATSTATLVSAWSGAVTISGSDAAGAASTAVGTRQFRILYGAMPAGVCIKLIPGMVQNFKTILVGTTPITNDPAATVAACSTTATTPVTFISE